MERGPIQRWRRSCHRRYRTSRSPTDAARSRCGDSDGFGGRKWPQTLPPPPVSSPRRPAPALLAALPENFYLIGRHEGDKVAVREADGKGPVQDFLASAAKENRIWIIGGTAPISSEDDKRAARAWSTTTPGGGLRATTRCISSDSIMKPSATTRRAPCRPAQRRSPCKAPSDGSRLLAYDVRFPSSIAGSASSTSCSCPLPSPCRPARRIDAAAGACHREQGLRRRSRARRHARTGCRTWGTP